MRTVGFKWMLYGIAFINFLYAPLMYYLKNPPRKVEEQEVRYNIMHFDFAYIIE